MRRFFSRAMRQVTGWFPRYGGGFSSFFRFAGTNIDWNEEAGVRYDNSIVMALIQFMEGAVQSGPRLIVESPIRGKRGREWREDDTHVLPRVIANNRYMTESQLIGGLILSLIVAGNGYWIVDLGTSNKPVGFIFKPWWEVRPRSDIDFGGRNAGEHLITCYEVLDGNGNWRQLPVEQVIHFRWGVDPVDPRMGLSPLGSSLKDIVTDNEATTIGASLLKNGGVLGWAISPKTEIGPDIEPEVIDRAAKGIARYTRGDMAGTPAPLPFPIEVTQLGYEPSKLVLDKQKQAAVERILAQYGIDPMVLGLPSQSKTFSNYEEANEAAVRRGVLRVLNIIAKTLTEQCLLVHYKDKKADYSLPRVGWDLSEVAALQEDQGEAEKRAIALWQSDLATRAEERQELGLEIDPERDNVFYSEWKASFITRNVFGGDDDGERQRRLQKRATRAALPSDNPLPTTADFWEMVHKHRAELEQITARLVANEISEVVWAELMLETLRSGHAHASNYGRQLGLQDAVSISAEDWARARRIVDSEQEYLHRFLEALEAKDSRYWDEELGEWRADAIAERQSKYLGKLRGTANEAMVEAALTRGNVEVYWRLGGNEEHCEECPQYADMSPFSPDELPTWPGDNDTPCMFNCKCYIEVKVAGEFIQGFRAA